MFFRAVSPESGNGKSAARPIGQRSAFTLIELLVVIAIIAILAAILFPVFAKAREKARQASCLSNTKQIGLGIMQYTQDYDEMLPARQLNNSSPPLASAEYSDWQVTIMPYVKSAGVLACPSNPNKGNTNFIGTYNGVAYPISYAVNRGPNRPFVDIPNDSGGTSLASLQAPANLIATVEIVNAGYLDFWVDNYNTFNGHLFAGHTGMTNYAFCDGHSKAMKPLNTLDTADGGANTTNLWTNDNSSFGGNNSCGNACKVLTTAQTTYQ
jgi:prepilin-type N-terminal cleavage/methylation domain-containing protein/prepilin-type processing-associated H-X9-DG protein